MNPLPAADRDRLRNLAHRLATHAHSDRHADLRRRWTDLNDLRGDGRPLILAETSGLFQSGEWRLEDWLACEDPWARNLEGVLLTQLNHLEEVCDDWVAEPVVNVPWHVEFGDFGVPFRPIHGGDAHTMGSYVWDPPVKSPSDLAKLHPRTCRVDREATALDVERTRDAVGDILEVRTRFGLYFWWSTGLTWTAIDLIGLENLMLWMVDEPEGLHALMGFLHDDLLGRMRWAESEGLITPNNENDYIGSGTVGYTSQLPKSTETPSRLSDLWVLAESQETVGVGPDMFEEFIFPYQSALAELGGLTYYGCCEPIHSRWHVVRRISNLRKLSVSPWCDQEAIAAAAGRDYVLCRKPNPALVSVEAFDEDAIRADLRHSLRVLDGCHVELVMKDVHTLAGEPDRLKRWCDLARSEIG